MFFDNNYFDQAVANFNSVTGLEATGLVKASEGAIIFVGRASCPYCQKFIRTLAPVAQETALKIHFLDTDNFDDAEDIKFFRDQYNVDTVPALVYASVEGPKTVCDSSLTAGEILAFVQQEA